jgi:hypothetical protein
MLVMIRQSGQCLLTRNYRLARFCAAAQIRLIVLGWALAQFPYLVEPESPLLGCRAERYLAVAQSRLQQAVLLLFPSCHDGVISDYTTPSVPEQFESK